MVRSLGLGVLVLALLAGMACNDGGTKVEANVFPVQVDGKATFAASFIAYFPTDVQAHAGDTVEFNSNLTGEPHTVTLGTQVDDIFDLVAEACPNGGLADPACQEGPPAQYEDQYFELDAKNPALLPEDSEEPDQAAAQPCFLATGAPPTDASACTEQEQAAFDGTQTFYNSGFLEDQQVFSVELSEDIAPGTYFYYCLLHREGMSGTVTVVDKDTDVPTADEVAQAGQAALDEMIAGLQPEVDRLATLTAEEATAGSFSEEVQEASIDEFAPAEIAIPVDGTVTWTVLGFHTISFNAPESARPFLVKEADGTVAVNEEAGTPAIIAGAPEPDPNAPPPDPNVPVVIDGGAWDGAGFANSGFIEAFEGTWQYKLTFSTAGTYPYICLVHPDMEGTIKVGE